ncbi:MAG: hypothetical protein R2791_07825 [Saprospiraceae bacterium]
MMKKRNLYQLYVLLFCSFFLAEQLSAQVAINQDNSAPDPSAMLDVKSSDKGMLVPRLSTAQRAAVANPATGLLVFDTDTESFWFRDSLAWVELLGSNFLQKGLLLNDTCYQNSFLDANHTLVTLNSLVLDEWQSFTAQSDGYFTRVEIRISDALGDVFDNGTFRFYQGEGTNGTLLYEKNINEVWGQGWHGTDIPVDSIYLTAGEIYTINFIDPDGFDWYVSYLNAYAEGMASENPDRDYNFKIYLSDCVIHYLTDPTTPEGTTNLNYIDTLFFADGTALTSLYDDQTLSLSGTTLSIEDGNSVDLASIDTDTDTDDQTLNLSGTTLSIEDGNSVDLSALPGDNLGNHVATQNINLNGNWLSGDGGDEGVFVRSNGFVGIGTSDPQENIHIFANTPALRIQGPEVIPLFNFLML